MDGERNGRSDDQPALPLKSQIESLVFVAGEPVPVDRLAIVMQISVEQAEQLLDDLAREYAGRGLRLQRKGRRVQMVTAPEAGDLVRTFLGLELGTRLSPAALEALAIIAYRQPVTRAQIEAVRGVNSDTVLRTLINHGLIEEQGRLDQVGRPIIYGTTFEFLQHFGLSSLDQLPALSEAPALSDVPEQS
jgi:segregation and condensation protein B